MCLNEGVVITIFGMDSRSLEGSCLMMKEVLNTAILTACCFLIFVFGYF